MRTARVNHSIVVTQAEAVAGIFKESGEFWVRLDAHFRNVETHDLIFF